MEPASPHRAGSLGGDSIHFSGETHMTIEVIGKDDDLCFNNLAWKLLIELALQFGWKPAGAMEPDEEEDGSEPDEEEDGLAAEQVVKLTEETLEQHRAPQDDAIAQAVKSLFFHSGDPVLDSYFNNAGFRVTADDANALADALDRALPDLPDPNALEHKVGTI